MHKKRRTSRVRREQSEQRRQARVQRELEQEAQGRAVTQHVIPKAVQPQFLAQQLEKTNAGQLIHRRAQNQKETGLYSNAPINAEEGKLCDLDEPPTDKELARMHAEIAYLWKNIGMCLDLKAYKLKAIEKDYPNSCEDACLEMLLTWKELNFNVSRRVLYQAITDSKQEVDSKDNIVDKCTEILKKRYDTSYVSENRWPPFTPAKFTKLGYIIYKPKRTAKDAEQSATSARSGSFLLENVEEEICNIFLPINKNKYPQIILIEGAPGIGKTMLMKEIGRLWATDKVLRDKKFLYYLSLRDPEINKMTSTEDMFFYSCKNRRQAEVCDAYFGNNGGQGLVILLDGLDENPQTMKSGSFLHKILIEQKIFREAFIVITSRPHATVDLLKYISYRVEIIGFTDKRRQEFVDENLEENAKDLKDYLRKHEIIDTLCYIPLNMTIVLFLFKEKVEMEDLPKTQTELTKKAVRMTVLHNLQKLGIQEDKNDLRNLPLPYDKIFYYLSKLAYDALREKKLTFTRDEIEEACPVQINGDEMIKRGVINGLGLIQKAEFFTVADGDIQSVSNFAHYSVQELLAAWYIAFKHHSYFQRFPFICNIQKGLQKCLQILFQLKVLTNDFWNGDFINMWSFYVGLTKGEDGPFMHFISGLCMPCKNYSWLMNYEIAEDTGTEQSIISKEILKSKIKMLLLYFLLQEAPGNKMIKYLNAVVTDKSLNISGQSLCSKQDLYLLGYILSRPYLTKQWESVDLSFCKIDDEIFETLHEVLARNDGRPKPDIKNLSLSSNRLKSCSSIIANLVCCQKISHLHLSSNILDNLIHFERCGDFLETFDVSYNKLGIEKAFESLIALRFLRKLKVLKLNHNGIKGNPDVNDAFGLALCSCNSLEMLELDGNTAEFKDNAMLLFKVIIEVRNSKSNERCYNKQSDKAYAFLKIMEYCTQLDYQLDTCTLRNKLIETKTVDVSYCDLGTDAGCCLGRCLHLLVNLRALDITKNEISDEASECLTKGMLSTPNLVEFKYNENLFNEKSIMIFEIINKLRTTVNKLFKCKPSEIKALLFILECINDNKELQSCDIVSVIGHVAELNLSHSESTMLNYKLTDKDLEELCELLTWFKQLEVLDIKNNHITDECKESLAMVMLQIDTLNSVNLIGNPVFDDELCMGVFDTIKNIREGQMQEIVDNQKNSSHILSHSVIFVMECISKLKNHTLFHKIIKVDINSESNYAGKFFEYLYFLPSLENLTINNVTYTTDYGMNVLSEYLIQNVTLSMLDLSGCNLENLEIKKGSRNNKSLEILKCNYSKINVELLRSFMSIFRNVAHLEIEGNNLCDEGITTLHNVLFNNENYQELHLLFNLKILKIANNNISCKSTRCLAIQMILNSKLEIDYSKNLFSEENIMIFKMINRLCTIKESFQCKPSEVKALSFILACINDNAVFKSVPSDIVSTISNVTRLNLNFSESAASDYKLSSEDLEELCAVLTLFKQLKVLDLTSNNITVEAKKSLVEAMLQIDTFNDLQLFGNPIYNSKLVFDTIIKLRENQVQLIDQKSFSYEEFHCLIYIMECLSSLNCCHILDSVTTLDIDSLSDHGDKFFKYLNFLPSLENLKINNVKSTTDIDMNLLSRYLCLQSTTLSKLDLSGCDLEKLKIDGVTKNDDSSLKVLKCNCCKITCKLLKHLLLLFKSIVHLELEENDLCDKGICTLYDVLLNDDQDRSMTTLNLAKNKITSSSSAFKIIEIVQKCKIICLDISHNRLSTFSCFEKTIATTLGEFPEKLTVTTLEELYIANNKLIIDEGITHILQNCKKLVLLDLKNNHITNSAFKYLASGYLYASKLTLRTFLLDDNPCMDDPFNVSVLEMVERLHWKSDYEHFKCLPAEFEVFLFILELVHSVDHKSDDVSKIISRIKNLDISYLEDSNSCDQQEKVTIQKLRSHDLKRFCKYLKYFKFLKCINMTDNNIEENEDIMDDLAIAVLRNSRIITVQLKGNPIHKLKKCAILFDTIEKMRTCGNSYVFENHPETLKALIYILRYIDKFDDKKCDITETIEHLDISQVYQIQSVGINKIDNPEKMSKDLVRHLKLFHKLKTLNLSHGCVTSETISELSYFLEDNATLLLLDLSYNAIQADGASVILKSLEASTCTILERLNLSNNKITGGKKCKDIADKILTLRKTHKITVDVANNKLSEESKKLLDLK